MKTLIVGVGSTIRGDDGVGVVAARRLKERLTARDIDIVELGTAGLGVLDLVEGYDRLILLDAIVTGAPPGTLHVLAGHEISRTVHLGAGHEADLPTTLALGKKLAGRHFPEDVSVIAVEAASLDTFSETLSPEVSRSIPEVLSLVEERVRT